MVTTDRLEINTIWIDKYEPAKPFSEWITRDSLEQRVLGDASSRVFAVNADSGMGKTTFLEQLYHKLKESEVSCSWLSIDYSDNRFVQFLSSFARSIKHLFPSMEEINLDSSSVSDNPGGLALELLDCVSNYSEQLILFMDDFSKIENPSVVDFLIGLINQFPNNIQIIIAGDNLVSLLGRVADLPEVTQLDSNDLRINADDVKLLIEHVCNFSISQDQAMIINNLAGGEVLEIRAIGMALANGDEFDDVICRCFDGRGVIQKFLLELAKTTSDEVLKRSLISYTKNFLSRRKADKVEALLASGCSTVTLELLLGFCLINSNQRLFKEIERSIEGRVSAAFKESLASFADYAAQQGLIILAIDLRMILGDNSSAIAMIRQHSEHILAHSHMHAMTRWAGELDIFGSENQDVLLQEVYLWARIFSKGPIFRSDRPADSEVSYVDINTTSDAILITDSVFSDTSEVALIEKCEDLLVNGHLDDFSQSAVILSFSQIALAYGAFDKVAEFTELFEQKSSYIEEFKDFFSATSGFVKLLKGDFKGAVELLKRVVNPAQLKRLKAANGVSVAGIYLAEAMYESNEIDLAERLLCVYTPLVDDFKLPIPVAKAHCLMARILFNRGNKDEAIARLHLLESKGYRQAQPRLIYMARIERSKLLLASGDQIRAGENLLSAKQLQNFQRDIDYETYSMVEFKLTPTAELDSDRLKLLADELEYATGRSLNKRRLCIKIIMATHYLDIGEKERFLTDFRDVLLLIAEYQSVRLILDGADSSRHLLERYVQMGKYDHGETKVIAREIIALMDAENRKVQKSPKTGILTKKEIQVVTLVSQGLSNASIADRMIVAETTVRTHLRNINLKLGVNNRTAAVAEARRLRFIG